MRKPRKCRNCGVVKEPLPRIFFPRWTFQRYRTGSLRIPKGGFVSATICPGCQKGVIWVYVDEVLWIKVIAVQPSSWELHPSIYYIKGKHVPHQQRCSKFLDHVDKMASLRRQDLIVDMPKVGSPHTAPQREGVK